jgi:hypothetical protein
MVTEVNPLSGSNRRIGPLSRPSRAPFRMPAANAWGLALSGSVLALSGLALVILRYVIPSGDAFSVYPHPGWRYVVMLHVLATPAFFFFVGAIWWRHVIRHWTARKRRVSGAAVVAILVLVAVSGYALYFIGGERLLSTVRIAHSATGAVAIVVYAHHAIMGWRLVSARRDRARSRERTARSHSL